MSQNDLNFFGSYLVRLMSVSREYSTRVASRAHITHSFECVSPDGVSVRLTIQSPTVLGLVGDRFWAEVNPSDDVRPNATHCAVASVSIPQPLQVNFNSLDGFMEGTFSRRLSPEMMASLDQLTPNFNDKIQLTLVPMKS